MTVWSRFPLCGLSSWLPPKCSAAGYQQFWFTDIPFALVFFVVNYCQTMMNYSPSQQLGLSPRLKREFGRNLCLCTNNVSIKTRTIYIGQDTREHLAESDHFGSCERTLPWAHFGLCLEIRKVEKDNHHLCFDVFRHLDIHNYYHSTHTKSPFVKMYLIFLCAPNFICPCPCLVE